MLMVQCFNSVNGVSVSATPTPHHSFLHYHSVTYIKHTTYKLSAHNMMSFVCS